MMELERRTKCREVDLDGFQWAGQLRLRVKDIHGRIEIAETSIFESNRRKLHEVREKRC